ncbi:hypothetical protein [Variovorax sp. RKNM96]|uniref:hypothetical protein n=1 Tax=Variovorax sp. RKNM96 TaxID=2681552 RepID=UPI001F12471E|nr:hypothetical protein [Variovorax sp. RKNM96]
MIIPQFWAEGRIQEQVAGKQFTVRRYGWSDDSPLAAQAHADQRTREAFDRIVSGEVLKRREPKLAYNGADGMPIREEILERQGDSVVTRNGYGARCLNTPDVMFVDVDFEDTRGSARGLTVIGVAFIGALVTGYATRSAIACVAAFVLMAAFGMWRVRAEGLRFTQDKSDPLARVRARVERFIHQHPDWHLRLYRTPAGMRVLAMHDVFAPSDAAVTDAFHALGADKVYTRMCRNQNCFRARLSAKPWRVDIREHLPRPERLAGAARQATRARRLGGALRKGRRGLCRVPVLGERGQHAERASERTGGAGTARRTHSRPSRFSAGLTDRVHRQELGS